MITAPDCLGGVHAVHHCHLLELSEDRIASDTLFCGGRWGPALLAEMGARMEVMS